jgi:hypothetical protein
VCVSHVCSSCVAVARQQSSSGRAHLPSDGHALCLLSQAEGKAESAQAWTATMRSTKREGRDTHTTPDDGTDGNRPQPKNKKSCRGRTKNTQHRGESKPASRGRGGGTQATKDLRAPRREGTSAAGTRGFLCRTSCFACFSRWPLCFKIARPTTLQMQRAERTLRLGGPMLQC